MEPGGTRTIGNGYAVEVFLNDPTARYARAVLRENSVTVWAGPKHTGMSASEMRRLALHDIDRHQQTARMTAALPQDTGRNAQGSDSIQS